MGDTDGTRSRIGETEMSTNITSADDRMPIIDDGAFAKVDSAEFGRLVTERYGEESTPEACAYRKLSSMFSHEQEGGIGAPRNLTYWAWRRLAAGQGSAAETVAEARMLMASTEIGAPIWATDMDELDAIANKAGAGEELTDGDRELLSDCMKTCCKWIDVAVRTKSNRSGLKDVAQTAA